jgi:MFS family permease
VSGWSGLVAAATTATQRYSPPRLQGRVNAAFMMAIITPQTVSIAAGTALISVVSYRLLLAIVAVAIGGCALVLLVRPAPEPADTEDRAAAGGPAGIGTAGMDTAGMDTAGMDTAGMDTAATPA